MSHDQNYKNLILDYPRQSLEFFAQAEAGNLDDTVRITPIRQEQLKERLGERFRELDVPLLVEWPDGRRETLLFVIEEESKTSRFSIHRLAHYCLDLSQLLKTDRVVPVVIFLRRAESAPPSLRLGGDRHTYLSFDYLSCKLAALPYKRYRDSDNIVVRLNLPNMRYAPSEKLEVYADAVRGLTDLEPDPEKCIKYLDFIDIYAALDDNERQRYQRDYPNEANAMTRFAERFHQEGLEKGMEEGRQQGMQQGMQQGRQKGEALILLRLLQLKFGELPEETHRHIDQADEQTLLQWSERVLSAQSLDEVLH